MTHYSKNRRTLWRSTIALGFLALGVVRGMDAQVVSSSPPPCLSPSRISADLFDEFKDLMVSRDAVATDMLSTYEVQRVQPSAVSTVRDSKVCEAASMAYSRAVNAQVSSVHVIRVGARYLVTNQEKAGGESKTVVTFDSTFSKALAMVAY